MINYNAILVLVLATAATVADEHTSLHDAERQQERHVTNRQEPLPILDMLFPDQAIDGAYEVHPLLAKSFPPDARTANSSHIPTIRVLDHNHKRLDRIQGLLPLSSIHSILSQQNMVHGSDFKLVKKVERDGEEWIGMLPGTNINADTAIHAVANDGFSLVINAMQRRWATISTFARQLHEEVQCHLVSCNLYLTPKALPRTENDDNGRRSGFESHWDYMDVIVIQVSGQKLWTVAKEPIVYLSNQDQKRKPTVEELKSSAYSDDVLLRPGDALYIPRGFVHNASTVVTKESNDFGPSLHLTFGLEHICDTTMEGLLHHAIHDFAMLTRQEDSIAISRQQCPQSPHDVLWEAVLHQTLGEVSRRDKCEETASFDNGGIHPCAGLLRRSVPLHPAFAEIFALANNNSHDEEEISNGVLLAAYLEAITLFVQHADVARLVGFMNQLFMSRDLQTSFCFPFMNDASVVICPNVLTSSYHIERFNLILKEFERFAVARAGAVLESFERYTVKDHRDIWKGNDAALGIVGQREPGFGKENEL